MCVGCVCVYTAHEENASFSINYRTHIKVHLAFPQTKTHPTHCVLQVCPSASTCHKHASQTCNCTCGKVRQRFVYISTHGVQ